MKKKINDLLLKMQTGENCIGETANRLHILFTDCDCSVGDSTNLEKIILLVNRKDGLMDIYSDGKCIGEGLDNQGVNELSSQLMPKNIQV